MQERLIQGGRIKRQKMYKVGRKWWWKSSTSHLHFLPSNPISFEFPKTLPMEMRPSKFPGPKTLNKNKEKGGEVGKRKVKMPRLFNPKYRNFPSCTHLTPFLNALVIATFIDRPIKTRVTCIRNHRSKPIHSLTFLSLCWLLKLCSF